jgi:hypothetical protein
MTGGGSGRQRLAPAPYVLAGRVTEADGAMVSPGAISRIFQRGPLRYLGSPARALQVIPCPGCCSYSEMAYTSTGILGYGVDGLALPCGGAWSRRARGGSSRAGWWRAFGSASGPPRPRAPSKRCSTLWYIDTRVGVSVEESLPSSVFGVGIPAHFLPRRTHVGTGGTR